LQVCPKLLKLSNFVNIPPTGLAQKVEQRSMVLPQDLQQLQKIAVTEDTISVPGLIHLKTVAQQPYPMWHITPAGLAQRVEQWRMVLPRHVQQ
jgi:hypothetical protein